jgi:hemolysin activation/secretion protein
MVAILSIRPVSSRFLNQRSAFRQIARFLAVVASTTWIAPQTVFAANEKSVPVVGEVLTIDAREVAQSEAKPNRTTKTCLTLDKVEIHGIALLDPKIIEQAVRPHLVRCLDNDNAKKLVVAVNEAYSKRGFITTQGYVPQQDIKTTKTFRINIVVGRVAKITYREKRMDSGFLEAWDKFWQAANPWQMAEQTSNLVNTLDNPLDRIQAIEPKSAGPWKTQLAMPVDQGDPVNLDHIQQGIDQINRAFSMKATAKLEPGEAPGTSDVVVTATRSDSFRFIVGYEVNGASLNNSNEATNAARFRLDLAKDNLLGINDAWATSLASGLDSNEVKASFAVPYRWLTFSLDTGYSENLTPIGNTAELFSKSFTSSANLSYLISRDKDQQTSAIGGLNWRHSERYINDVPLTPQTITYLKYSLNHTRYFDDRQLFLSLGVSKGIAAFDATKDPAAIDSTMPRAQFFRIDGASSYTQVFKGWGMWKLEASGQWTNAPLYADDQSTLGSASTVRGFTRAPFKVDSGLVIRSEFAAANLGQYLGDAAKQALAPIEEYIAGYQPYAFADFGAGKEIANSRVVQRAAIGAGIRHRVGRFTIDLSVAKPLYQEGLTRNHDTFKPEFYLTLTSKVF